MTSAASTTAASTPAPPLATGPPHHSLLQPTLTRVALTCIYTARTSHSRHRLPLAARFHSTARAPADTFLVPARSPRNTRPSRRPPRSARPLVRPTSFMRTTTPMPPQAKALRNSRFNLRFSSRCDLRPSPALFAPPPREINTIAQPRHTPLRTHTTRQAHTSQWTRRGARTRARRSTPRSTSSPTSSQPRDTNPPSTGVPPSPAGRHACGAASVGPAAARARLVRMLHAHAHEAARARCPLPRLPDSVDSAPAEARRHLRWPSARGSAPPRLFC
jgi:hypothetical protein